VFRPVKTIAPGSKIIRIAAGNCHTLALRSDGTVLAWGDNTHGELGDASTASTAGPVQVAA
jgi:alpha-tubulin suppressor-like RCC1 family protein